MANAFGMHELEGQDQLRSYALYRFLVKWPVFDNEIVQVAIVDVVNQKVQILFVLETAYDFDEEG